MEVRTIIIAFLGVLVSYYASANTDCLPGVYSDGKSNVVVVHEKPGDAELGYLTLNGFFGKINPRLDQFKCQPQVIRLNNDNAAPLNSVPLRRTLTTFTSANTQITGELIEPLNAIQNTYPLVVINGEYSGAMLRMSDNKLQRIGQALFDNLEVIWNYESVPVIKNLSLPILWVIAEQDHEAPTQRTLQTLGLLKKRNSNLNIYIFPNTDHGMYEFNELSDGSRKNTRITNGYFRLIAEWIHEKETPYSGNGFLY